MPQFFDAFPGRRIGYVGHSQGGAVGLLAATSDERLRFFVSLAGMVHTREFAERMFGHLRPGELMLDKPGRVFGAKYMDEMRELDTLVESATRVRIPWLLVHGDADDVVPLVHATDVHAASEGRAELQVIAGAGHSFLDEELPQMLAIAVPWILARCEG